MKLWKSLPVLILPVQKYNLEHVDYVAQIITRQGMLIETVFSIAEALKA